MAPEEVFSQLNLWMVNFVLNPTLFVLNLTLFACNLSCFYLFRICIRNANLGPATLYTDPIWIRIHNTKNGNFWGAICFRAEIGIQHNSGPCGLQYSGADSFTFKSVGFGSDSQLKNLASKTKGLQNVYINLCCGFGSVLGPNSGVLWNQIRIPNTDPDPHMKI